MKCLGASLVRPYIIIGGQKIYTLFDPPHLLKCTASLFRKHNVELPVPMLDNAIIQARFSDVRKAYEIDVKSPLILRSMHEIKVDHMVYGPKLKYAMKVSIAAQVMSRTVSAYLYTLLSRGDLEQRSLATATFINQVDKLFDSFNGSSKFPPPGKDLKCLVTAETGHVEYWKEAERMVRGWTFLRRTKGGVFRKNKPPSQVAWMTTIRAVRALWKHLNSFTPIFESLKPRNLDALENLFGAVRSGLGNNDNPTTVQSRTVHTRKSEEPSTFTSTDLKGLTINAEEIATDVANGVHAGSTPTMSVAYVGGFIVRRILTATNCENCKTLLLSHSDDPHNVFISLKEWDENKERLVYPSENPVISVGVAVSLLEDFLESNCNTNSISKTVEKELLSKVDFSWITCRLHYSLISESIAKGVAKLEYRGGVRERTGKQKFIGKELTIKS